LTTELTPTANGYAEIIIYNVPRLFQENNNHAQVVPKLGLT